MIDNQDNPPPFDDDDNSRGAEKIVFAQNPSKKPTPALRSRDSIIPRGSVAGRALIVVIAIMTFLACLTIGATSVINQTANAWRSDISREVTIQIRPSDDVEMDNAIRDASRIALSYDGVTKVTAIDDAAVSRLLEPWLGKGVELSELPMPGLLTVSLDGKQAPDFSSMSMELEQSVPGASLDDHRTWVDRLTNMAWTMVMIGVVIFLLVMSATVLIVVFTTPWCDGRKSGNNRCITFCRCRQRIYITTVPASFHYAWIGRRGNRWCDCDCDVCVAWDLVS